MKKETATPSELMSFWSDKQKKAMKLDFSSFMERMQERLKKVRGEASSDNFWTRYHYQKSRQAE